MSRFLAQFKTMSKLPLAVIFKNFDELNQKLISTQDQKDLIKLSKQLKPLQKQKDLADKIQTLENNLQKNQEMLKELESEDAEMLELAKAEIEDDQANLAEAEESLLTLLTPVDERDGENIYLEIRAGAGGDESSLFAAEMLKMYQILADKCELNFKLVSSSVNSLGGFKEAIAEIKGDSPFNWFKYESGVHRVQRVPETEKQGRVHTSTVSVAVMPLLENGGPENFQLNMDEVEIMVAMASGNGGQSVNTTYSAVKMRHKPTGIEAQAQEKNQIQNRENCIKILTARVYNHFLQERLDKETAERRSQVGTASRNEKIRTYNFPQDRITDHRYKKSWNQLDLVLKGEIFRIIQDIKKVEAEKNLETLQKE